MQSKSRTSLVICQAGELTGKVRWVRCWLLFGKWQVEVFTHTAICGVSNLIEIDSLRKSDSVVKHWRNATASDIMQIYTKKE
jgi:hypothetical protein